MVVVVVQSHLLFLNATLQYTSRSFDLFVWDTLHKYIIFIASVLIVHIEV